MDIPAGSLIVASFTRILSHQLDYTYTQTNFSTRYELADYTYTASGTARRTTLEDQRISADDSSLVLPELTVPDITESVEGTHSITTQRPPGRPGTTQTSTAVGITQPIDILHTIATLWNPLGPCEWIVEQHDVPYYNVQLQRIQWDGAAGMPPYEPISLSGTGITPEIHSDEWGTTISRLAGRWEYTYSYHAEGSYEYENPDPDAPGGGWSKAINETIEDNWVLEWHVVIGGGDVSDSSSNSNSDSSSISDSTSSSSISELV